MLLDPQAVSESSGVFVMNRQGIRSCRSIAPDFPSPAEQLLIRWPAPRAFMHYASPSHVVECAKTISRILNIDALDQCKPGLFAALCRQAIIPPRCSRISRAQQNASDMRPRTPRFHAHGRGRLVTKGNARRSFPKNVLNIECPDQCKPELLAALCRRAIIL